jgi:MFS family permease
LNVYPGWRIAAASAGLSFLQAALLTHAFGAYVAVLAAEHGWSKTALAGGAAIQSLEGAVLGPVLGWMIDRFGARKMVQAGVVLLSAGFVFLGSIETIAGFYMAMILVAVGNSLSGYFPLSVAIMHWFEKRRARALAVMSGGLAFGGFAVPIVGAAMQAYGSRPVAYASAVIVLVLGWPLACMVRNSPAEMGLAPDGEEVRAQPQPKAQASATAAAQAPQRAGLTARDALRTRAFWLLGLGHGFALLVVSSVNVHAITHMKEGLGYSIAQASFVISLMTASQFAGVVLGGMIGDRWDKRYIAAACMVAHMTGLLMLTYAVDFLMLAVFAVTHGIAWGLRGPLMQAIRGDYFGLRAIGMIMGLSAIIIATGQIVGPVLAGALADATGNYRLGFTILALTAGTGSLLFILAKKPD